MSELWETLRGRIADRLRLRAEHHHHAGDRVRAEEATACEEIVRQLAETYQPPEHPVRAGRGEPA